MLKRQTGLILIFAPFYCHKHKLFFIKWSLKHLKPYIVLYPKCFSGIQFIIKELVQTVANNLTLLATVWEKLSQKIIYLNLNLKNYSFSSQLRTQVPLFLHFCFSQDDTDLDYQSLFAMPDADVLAQLIAMSQMNAASAGGNKKKKGKKNKLRFKIKGCRWW